MKMKMITSNSVRKAVLTALMAAPAAFLPSTIKALPTATSFTVGSGTATGAVSGTTLTITASNKAVLNWVDFGAGAATIASGDVVNFTLGSSSAAVLNRVTGTSATTINGGIVSDGKVFILNPNGITIAPGAAATDKILTAGFYASTVQEPDGNFLANGALSYSGSTTAAGNITLTNAVIDVVTKGGTDIVLAGRAISGNGTFTGNLTVRSFDGGNISLTGGSVSKSLDIANSATGGTVTLASASGLTVTNDLTITESTTAGAITLAGGGAITVGGNMNIAASSVVAAVDLGASAVATTVSGNVTIATKGAVSQSVAGSSLVNSGASSVTNVAATAGATLSGNFSTVKLSAGANSSITDTVDSFAMGTSSVTGTLGLSAASGNITKSGTDTIAVSSTLSLTTVNGGTADIAATGDITMGAVNVGALGTFNLNTTGAVSLAAITAGNTTVVTTGAAKNISGAGAITATNASFQAGQDISLTGAFTTTSASFQAGRNITVSNAANTLGSLVLKGGATSGAATAITNNAALTIANGTNSSAATTITTTAVGTVTFGAATSDTITFGGALTVDATGGTGAIATTAYGLTVSGTSTLKTAGTAIAFGANNASTTASLARVDANSAGGNIAIYSSGDLNLGTVAATGGTITAKSFAGNITNSGAVTGTAAVTLETLATKDITLNNAGNALAGTITVTKANNFALTNTVATTVQTSNAVAKGTFAVGANNLTVSGAATDFGAVEVTATGASIVAITDKNAVTLQNTAVTAGTAAFGITTTTGDLTIGSGNSINTTAATTFTSTAGNILQTGAVYVAGTTNFVATAGAVTATAAGNNFGTIGLNVGAASSVSEGGYMKVGTVTAGSKAVTLTSETSTVEIVGSITTSGALTLSAASGAVKDSSGGTNAATGTLTITAKDNTNFVNAAAKNLSLGNITVTAGTLTLATSGAGTISQAATSSIYSFGDASFTTAATAITLGNDGNQFGKVTLDTAGGAAAIIKESTTLNLKYANVTDLTATSVNGSIITSAASAANKLVSSGTATFKTTAAGTSLSLGGSDNEFANINLQTPGSAVLLDKNTAANGLTLVGGSSGTNVGGAMTLTSTGGALADNGSSIYAFGDTTLTAASISLNDGNNQFGALKVTTTGNVYIAENTTLNLAAGSSVGGNAEFTSYGNVVTSGTGGSTFTGSLRLNASGSITITNPIYVGAGLTVNAPGVKDLSYLSKSVNLNGIAPTVLQPNAGDKAPAN